MTKENTIFGIVGAAIIFLVFTQFNLFTLFSVGTFDFEKTISYNDLNANVYSTRDFGETNILIGGYYDLAENYVNDVPDNKFLIDLNSYSSSNDGRVGTPLGKTDTYILTNNLEFNTINLKELDILFLQENFMTCQDSDMSGITGGSSSISLVGPETIVLFQSSSPYTYHNPSSSASGQIIITKDGEDFLINLMGETNLINIPEGEYELKISANVKPCFDGGRANEKIEITRLILEKELVEQSQNYYHFGNNECNQINILPSEKTANDYLTLSECETHINLTGDCNYYYWFDDSRDTCGYKEFCGLFMYQDLRIFNTLNECEQEIDHEIICPTGFTYNSITDKCEKHPDTGIVCLDGTYNPQTGQCEIYPEIKKEWFTQTVFPIGDFDVEIWMLIIFGGLFLLVIGGRR